MSIDAYKDLANEIKKTLEVDAQSGKITVKDGQSPFEENLPEDLTKKQVKAVEKYQADYVTASTIAATEVAQDAFKKNKELDRVTAEMPYGIHRGKVTVTIDKERTFRDPQTGNEIKKPQIVTSVKAMGTKVSKSILQDLKTDLQKAIS